jgi:hypothetical protein
MFPTFFMTFQLVQNNVAPLQISSLGVKLGPSANEENSLMTLALKCRLLSACGSSGPNSPVALKALFPLDRFPNLDSEFNNVIMKFASFELIQSPLKIDCSTWNTKDVKSIIRKGFVLNVDKAAFADYVISNTSGTFVVLVQEKQSEVAKQKYLSHAVVEKQNIDSVIKEHEKCKISTNHLFVLITDREFSDHEKLKTNEIVISRKEQEAVFGPLLALLRLVMVGPKRHSIRRGRRGQRRRRGRKVVRRWGSCR